MFKCTHCKSMYTNREWDSSTRTRFGNEIVNIGERGDMEDASFKCPGCGELSEGYELTAVKRRLKGADSK